MGNKKMKQLHRAPDNCPICNGRMFVRELECHECGTRIKGSFKSQKNTLEMDEELFDFIKVFVFAEGSIKQSEKILNCSYPKVKNLLKKAKKALGFVEDKTDSTGSIIDQLDQGKIDVEAALEKLKTAE
jgi:hypothetical protein